MTLEKGQEQEYDFAKAAGVLSFFVNELGACGCSEFEPMIGVVRDLLEWAGTDGEKRPLYSTLFDGNVGVYYILVGILGNNDLCWHGVSIRHPGLTRSGERLLLALQTMSAEEIEASDGVGG